MLQIFDAANLVQLSCGTMNDGGTLDFVMDDGKIEGCKGM